MNLNLLPALDALLEAGSVTEAARRAGISQPAMSHSLAQLRALFDDPLIVRGGARTPLAEAIRERLRIGLGEIRSVLEMRERFDPSTVSRRFRLAVSDAFPIIGLPALWERMVREAPGVDLVIRPPTAARAETLASGEVSMVLGSEEQIPAGTLRSVQLYRERFVCITRRVHPKIPHHKLTLPRYVAIDHAVVANDEDDAYLDRVLAKEGRTRRVALRLPDYAGLGHVIASTELLATVPERLALHLAKALPLRIHAVPITLPRFPIAVAWHGRWDGDPGHRWMRELLIEVAREERAARRGS